MVVENLSEGETRLFFEQDALDSRVLRVPEGVVAVHSTRSPVKETPNEDAAAVIHAGSFGVVLAVADGMGGAPAGGQASAIAVQCLADSVASAMKDGTQLRSGILNGFESANQAVLDLGVGAATTLTVAEVDGVTARHYHVGDSLILLTGQRGRIKMQSIPHSPVGYGVESGLLDETEAMYHEERHVISNVIGSADMRIEVGSALELKPRDTLLLASDGLSDNLHLSEIVEQVRKGALAGVTHRLAEAARERMSPAKGPQPSKPDDLTFLLFRLVGTRSKED